MAGSTLPGMASMLLGTMLSETSTLRESLCCWSGLTDGWVNLLVFLTDELCLSAENPDLFLPLVFL